MNLLPRQAELQDVADIRVGFTLRGPDALRAMSGPGPRYLRISDLTEDGRIAVSRMGQIQVSETGVQRYLLQRNDILMANRGNRLACALFDENIEAVAGNQFYIVRLTSDKLSPEFVRWFLNTDATSTRLLARSTGSYIKSVPIGELRKLPVPIPSLEIQRTIVALAELRIQERELIARLENLKESLLQRKLRNTAAEGGRLQRSNKREYE